MSRLDSKQTTHWQSRFRHARRAAKSPLGSCVSSSDESRRSLTKNIAIGLVFALLVITSATTTLAQNNTKPKPDLTEMSLEELMNIEIYSASKFPQKIADAPASVSIVTADEIQRYGYRTLADIIRSVRGFYVTYDRNYSYVGVRGFGRTGDYNTRVLVMVDGHRLNDNIYDGAYIGTDFVLDVDLIDRVEIIRGPSSSLYGTNAFFAVINIITKRGRAINGFETSAEAAGFGTYKGRVSYGKRFKRGPELLLSGSFYDSAGPGRLYFREFDDPATNYGVAVSADGDQYGSVFVTLALSQFTVRSAYNRREKHIPTASYDTVFNDPRNRTVDQWGYVDLQYERRWGRQWDVTTRVYYDHYHYDGTYLLAGPELNKDFSRGRWWGVEPRLTGKFLGKHTLTVGGEFRHNLQQDQGNYSVDPVYSYFNDQRSSQTWALYAQEELFLRKNLILNLGVRHDHYESFGGTTNPRLGVIYSPWERTTIKALYGEAFRAPNAFELFYGTGVFYKSNPNLMPETIKTGEVVFERYFGSHSRLTASAFRYEMSGLISAQTDPTDGLLVFRNLDATEAGGLEAELEGRWMSGLAGRLSYSFHGVQDARTSAVLVNSPRHLAKAHLTLPLAKKKAFAGLELLYASKRKTLVGDYTKGFLISNLTLLSQKLPGGFDLSASVYNLLNQKYGDPGAEEHRQKIIFQDGRSFRVKLTYRF